MHARLINHGKHLASSASDNLRVRLLLAMTIVMMGVLVLRLYSLQIVAHAKYQAIAENQHEFTQQLLPDRGEIFLKNETERYPLAVNQDVSMAFMVPKEVVDKDETAVRLSQALGLDKSLILSKLSDPEDMYEILKKKLGQDEVGQVKELKLPGVYLQAEKFRLYPGNELASQLVGFVGSDGDVNIGRYGLEAFWEERLRGESGSLRQEGDSRGRWISIADRDFKEAKNGDSLLLTLDYRLQYETEKILRETVEKHKADSGTAIVMDPHTGRVLAMANFPDFNPNEFGRTEEMKLFANPAVSSTFECGSVFKPITAAIALDDGKIEPDTTYTDRGSVLEAGYTIKNSEEKVYGLQTMTQVLESSVNTGAIHMEKVVGNKNFREYVRRFGFGEKTGIDLPAEAEGNLKNLDNARQTINFYTASFGQGIAVTPLQVLNAFATMANGGNLMKPQIVEKIIHADGSEEEIVPQVVRRVITEDTSRKIGRMLRSVVVNGHGKRADVPGYLVGGKTGTAQVAKSGAKGYEDNLTIGSFVGYAPIDDPQFAILVKIENPKDVQWAESTAAPAFGRIMKKALEYYRIEPTEEYELPKNVTTGIASDAKPAEAKKPEDKKKD